MKNPKHDSQRRAHDLDDIVITHLVADEGDEDHSAQMAMSRPKRARTVVNYNQRESDASDVDSDASDVPSEWQDEDDQNDCDDDDDDDDVEQSDVDDEYDDDDDDVEQSDVDEEYDDDCEDNSRIREQVMREFNKEYAAFDDFTTGETRDAFRWAWNIERGGRSVPVAELVSDSDLVQSHVNVLSQELERAAAAGSEGDYLLKATELQQRHMEFMNSGIVQTTRKLAETLKQSYHVPKLREHGGIPNAYRCPNAVCTLFACFLVRVIPGNIKARIDAFVDSVPSGVADPLAERIEQVVSADDIWKHIEGDMKSLDAGKYIRRCIGGAVAMLTLARKESRLPPWYTQWFEPNYYRQFAPDTGAGPHRANILGASRNADVDDGHCRLIVRVFPKAGLRRCEETAMICMHVPSKTPLESVLDVARQKYDDVGRFFGANGGLPQLFFARDWEFQNSFLVRAGTGVVNDWDTSKYTAVYDVQDVHTCPVPYASLFLGSAYPAGEAYQQEMQSISLKFTTALRNSHFLQRFVGQDDVNAPIDEDKLKEKLIAGWVTGTKLTLDASLATLGVGRYALLTLGKGAFPTTDKAYWKLRNRLQNAINKKTQLLSERWKSRTLSKLNSLRATRPGKIRPGKRFQIFCYSMSDVHDIEILANGAP